MKAPERIWIPLSFADYTDHRRYAEDIEYIRADLVPDCDSQDCPYKRAFKVEIGGK